MATRYAETHPMDFALEDMGLPASGMQFPPAGWRVISEWGCGWALQSPPLRVIVDCSRKDDNRFWLHVSVSRADRIPTHADMCAVKKAFFGDRYAYTVHPPESEYVNIHEKCLHLWGLVDAGNGRVLPEFASVICGQKSI